MFEFSDQKLNYQPQVLEENPFVYRKTVQHGFPANPTVLAFDHELHLMALGTASGMVKVFGRRWVEFYTQLHHGNGPIEKLAFFENNGELLAITSDNFIHILKINDSPCGAMELVMKHSLGNTKVADVFADAKHSKVFIAFRDGSLKVLAVTTADIICEKVVSFSDYSPIQTILHDSLNEGNFIIGFDNGVILYWRYELQEVIRKFEAGVALLSICWNIDRRSFVSAHSDGTYKEWQLNNSDHVNKKPYGPGDCTSIVKIYSNNHADKPLRVFTGGLPSGSTKHAITIIDGDVQQAIQLGCEILDFCMITVNYNSCCGFGSKIDFNSEAMYPTSHAPASLLILTTEELVCISIDDNLAYKPHYLESINFSKLTINKYYSDHPEDLWYKLSSVERTINRYRYNNQWWPVIGGGVLCQKGSKPRHDLMLTGHENGIVQFLECGEECLQVLYVLDTRILFGWKPSETEETINGQFPIKKFGKFNPEDVVAGLGIRAVEYCPLSQILVVANESGYVFLSKYSEEPVLEPKIIYASKHHQEADLKLFKGVSQPVGFMVNTILKLNSSAQITASSLQSELGALAIATTEGVFLYNYASNDLVKKDIPNASYLYFAKSNIEGEMKITLWVGTNSGELYKFVYFNNASEREWKQMEHVKLDRSSPVIFVTALDATNRPLPKQQEVDQRRVPADTYPSSVKLLVATEEQFEVFELPETKAYGVYRFSKHEGSKLMKVAIADFYKNFREEWIKAFLLCMSSDGKCHAFNIPHFEKLLTTSVVEENDEFGKSTLVLTKRAETLYYHSPSEIQRASLSNRRINIPPCYIHIPKVQGGGGVLLI